MRLFALLLLLLPATAAAGEWTATDPPIDYGHIAYGRINAHGEAVGYHSRPGGIDPANARVRRIVQRADAMGVYRAFVAVRDPATGAWIDKRAPSTFFPDRLSSREVADAVLHAFHGGTLHPDGYFVGPSGRGFAVAGWYHGGHIVAAYPLRGP